MTQRRHVQQSNKALSSSSSSSSDNIGSSNSNDSKKNDNLITKLPWGTNFINRLQFFNPSFWYGMIDILIVAKLLDWKLILLQTMIGRVLVPLFLFLGMLSIVSIISIGGLSLKTMIGPTISVLISPWTMGSISRTIPTLQLSFNTAWGWKSNRCPALPDAIESLEERIVAGTAYRTRRYDIYLGNAGTNSVSDEQNENTSTENSINKAMIFIPGALVEHTSYAKVAGLLADEGFTVIVINCEPSRVAYKYMSNADVRPLTKIKHHVLQKKYLYHNSMKKYRSPLTSLLKKQKEEKEENSNDDDDNNTNDPTTSRRNNFNDNILNIDEWIIVGHSQGARQAMEIANELQRQQQRRRQQKKKGRWQKNKQINGKGKENDDGWKFSKIILLAPGNMEFDPPSHDTDILVLQGENDPILGLYGDRQAIVNSLKKKLKHGEEGGGTSSIKSKEVIIAGANHQQFGSYQVNQSFRYNSKDVATISRQEQHEMIRDLIVTFLYQ